MSNLGQVGLAAFLQLAKSALKKALQERGRVTIVTGNQSADLDSMTSSILYALVRSQAPPANAFTPLYVPLLNVPAADVALRPEFLLTFQRTQLQPSDLITLDDLPAFDRLQADLPAENTRWILVDHNRLEGALGEVYGNCVHGVVDHHEEEHVVPQDTAPEPRVIETCGSCTSLVLRTLLGTPAEAPGSGGVAVSYTSAQAEALSGDAANLALASILVDTHNLENQDKVRPTDVAVAGFLAAKAQEADSNWRQDKYFKEVQKAKRSIDDLPLQGILRKDYKQFRDAGVDLGMSTVVKPLDFLVEKAKDEEQGKRKESWNKAAAEFVSKRKLGIWAILTTFSTKEGDQKQSARQICLQYKDEEPESSAVRRFERDAVEGLRLEQIDIKGLSEDAPDGYRRKIWQQGDTSKSRKQIAPLLRAAITAQN